MELIDNSARLIDKDFELTDNFLQFIDNFPVALVEGNKTGAVQKVSEN
ncbi:hypothetical protein [Sporosarcina sp. YIM B06819]|nr:hypothetical protein [Sporosarcina sp. YIM B06819]